MIHLFEVNGDKLAFEPQTGALHLVDQTAYAVLELYKQCDGRQPAAAELSALADSYGDAVYAAAREIDTCIDNGQLFVPDQPFPPLSAFYPDGPRVKSMCLHVAHDCNLRCRYCFAGTGDFGTGSRVRMDVETGKKAVEFLLAASGDRKNLDLDFFGGEPLLNWPLVVTLTEYCERRGAETGKNIRLTITTNATLLDEDKIGFINEHMKNCVLSIDGRPAIHDHMRPDAGGRGSYGQVAERVRSFIQKRGDREHYVRGTFTRHNLDFGDDVMHLASLGAKYISMEPVVAPDGSGYEIRREDLPAIRAEYERLAADYVAARASGHWFSFFHFMIDLDGGPCAVKRLKGCGAGSEYVAVTPEGDIYPCHQFVGETDFIMGHVDQEPHQLKEEVRARFSQLLIPQKPACATCWARNYCGGGCAANAWHAVGDVNGAYEIGCEMQKKRVECALWVKAREHV